jgi:Predicted metal-binding integral membrane protein (DUF2182)
MLGMSVAGWIYLLAPYSNSGPLCCSTASGLSGQGFAAWLGALGEWSIMVVAMMFPLMVTPVRFAAFASLWGRRHLAIGAFLLAYLAVWLVAGTATLALTEGMRSAHWLKNGWSAGVGFLLAAAWQFTPIKRRLAVSCHRTRPLAPVGWPAHRDCLLFGLDHGMHCVPKCGLLMFVAMLSPSAMTMMAASSLLLYYERYWARRRKWIVPGFLCAFGMVHFIP